MLLGYVAIFAGLVLVSILICFFTKREKDDTQKCGLMQTTTGSSTPCANEDDATFSQTLRCVDATTGKASNACDAKTSVVDMTGQTIADTFGAWRDRVFQSRRYVCFLC